MYGVNIWVYKGRSRGIPRSWSQLTPLPHPSDVSLQWYLGSPSRASLTMRLDGALMEMSLPFSPSGESLHSTIVGARVLVSWDGVPVWLGWVSGYRMSGEYVVLDAVGFMERMKNVVVVLPVLQRYPVKSLLEDISERIEILFDVRTRVYVQEGLVCNLPSSEVVSISGVFDFLAEAFPDKVVGAGLDENGEFALWVLSPPSKYYIPPGGEETVEVSSSGEPYWLVVGVESPLVPNLLPPLFPEMRSALRPVSGPLHPNLSFALGDLGWNYPPGSWEFRQPDLDGNYAAWVVTPGTSLSSSLVPVQPGKFLTVGTHTLIAPGGGGNVSFGYKVVFLNSQGGVVEERDFGFLNLPIIDHLYSHESRFYGMYIRENVAYAKLELSALTAGVGLDVCNMFLSSLPADWKFNVGGAARYVSLYNNETREMYLRTDYPPRLLIVGQIYGPSGYVSLSLGSPRPLPFVGSTEGRFKFFMYSLDEEYPDESKPKLRIKYYNSNGALITESVHPLGNGVSSGTSAWRYYVYTTQNQIPPPPTNAVSYSVEVGVWGETSTIVQVYWHLVGLFTTWEENNEVSAPSYPYGDANGVGGPYISPVVAPPSFPPIPYSYREVSLPVSSDEEFLDVVSRRRIGPLHSLTLSFSLGSEVYVRPELFRPHLYRWVWRGVPWVVSELDISGGTVTARLGEAVPPLWQVLSG